MKFIKESPDSLKAVIKGKTYYLSLTKYNPVTFFHIYDGAFFTDLSNSAKDKVKDKFGFMTVYAPTNNTQFRNFHSHIFDLLVSGANTLAELKDEYGINIYVHDSNKRALFEQYKQKYPNLQLYLPWSMGHEYAGRSWSISNNAVFAMWEFRKDIVANTTVPFLKFLYPGKNIYFQRANGDPVLPLSELNKVQELKPYEQELAGWLAQLHIASGDEARKNEIKSEIDRIIKKYNLDPKKYGIGAEVPKSSENMQKKLLGKSKMSMAELKSKERTSESSVITFRDYYLSEKSIHDPVRPGILKRQVKGKMTCSKARSLKSKQKNKGNNTAKAAQRYLNYHC